jgi:PAS domain S-box-containing protein
MTRQATSIRKILITLGAISFVYVLTLTLEIATVLAPAARRLQGTTGAVLVEHDRAALRLETMRGTLEEVRRHLLAVENGGRPPGEALARLKGAITARLGDGVAMRAAVGRVQAPSEVRLRLAQAVESETAADLTLLDAIRAIDLGRTGVAQGALRDAAVNLDSTAVRLAGVQRTAIADVLEREGKLLGEIQRLTRWGFGWVGLGGLLLLFGAWLLRERLYRPVADLQGAIDRIAAGDLEATVPVRRHDEFGHLATHVNAMTEMLRERSSEVARRHHGLEERFGRILDQSSNEIYLFDGASLACVQANQGAQANLGYSMGELSGLTLHDLLRDRSREALDGELALLRRGDHDRLLLTGVQTRKNGTSYPVEMTLQYATSEEAPLFVAVVDDISARSRVREMNERIRQFAFSRHQVIGGGDLVPALHAITEMAQETLGTSCATVWLYSALHLRGIAGWQEGRPLVLEDREIREADFPAYFEALVEGSVLAISDAARDPRTRELVGPSGPRAGASALLAAPVRAAGRLVAVVAVEQLGAHRTWSLEEEAFIGSVADLVALAMEAAERRGLEAQLAQAKKMDSIGRLAGGVAHDFNNLLTAILGHIGFARGLLAPEDPVGAELDEIDHAARRAAELTRQLLTFARRQVIAPRVVDLNEVARGAERLLRRLLGEDVELLVNLEPELGSTRVDPGQFEQVIVNLAVNARDAMPGGGRLLIETRNVTLDTEYAATHPDTTPGEYVQLAVTDTGTGMDRATVARLFEPFFTTKEQGRGTGLGLAICYGIVRQAGGNIWVYSEPGRGTTFKVHLPRVGGAPTPQEDRAIVDDLVRGTESILVAEDERQIRDLITRVLTTRGYRVTAAVDGEAALAAARNGGDPIDLLITDVVLPRLGGPDLVRELRRDRPGLVVLYISGYTAESTIDRDLTDTRARFLPKPFTPVDLAARVREVLALRKDEAPTSTPRT